MGADDERVASRADGPPAEEADSADAEAQAAAILEESDERTLGSQPPGERRTSDEATPPTDT